MSQNVCNKTKHDNPHEKRKRVKRPTNVVSVAKFFTPFRWKKHIATHTRDNMDALISVNKHQKKERMILPKPLVIYTEGKETVIKQEKELSTSVAHHNQRLQVYGRG